MSDLCPDCGHPNSATNPYCFCGPGRSLIERLKEIPSLTCAEAAAALFEAQATIARQQAMLDRALEDNGGMMAEIARLRGLLIEERTETLWNAYHTGHEKDGMWDHCCMSDGEWLAAECGLPPSQRVYSAEAIKTAIPVAARRAALSRPHATKGEAG